MRDNFTSGKGKSMILVYKVTVITGLHEKEGAL